MLCNWLFFVLFGKSRGGEGGRKEEMGWEEERKTALGGGRREERGGRRREKEDPTLTQLSGVAPHRATPDKPPSAAAMLVVSMCVRMDLRRRMRAHNHIT